MQTSTFKRRLAKAAVVSAVAALGVASVMAGGSTAGADPKQDDAPLIAMGSDTTQDILDAFAGEVNGKLYTPLRSSSTLSGAGVQTGRKQIASWRAVNLDASGNPEQCVEPAGGINVDRPNGSGAGKRALSASVNGVGYGVPAVTCTSTFDNFAGLISFGRSSSGATGTTGNLTYVPFARDALQFAYSAPSVPLAVSDLTTAEVQGLHTNSGGTAVLPKGGTRIIACRIQDGSGTYTSWGTFMGLTVPGNATDKTTLQTSTQECANAFDTVEKGINGLQEHDPVGLKTVCDRIRAGYTMAFSPFTVVAAQPNTECIVGYSAANWVAQFNDRGTRNLPITPTAATGGAFNLGTRDGGVAAYVINGPADSAPNAAYFAGSFGRDMYNIVPTSIITLPGNTALKTMLIAGFDSEGPGSGPAMCGTVAVATRTLMGFGAPQGNPCGAVGAFNKSAYDLANTGPIGSGGA